MNRDNWLFEVTSARLLDAAKAKREFHTTRLKFWKESQEKCFAEAKEKGLTISESLAGSDYSSVSNRPQGPQIQVDLTYQRQLAEAHNKIGEHMGKISAYDGWIQVLEGNSKASYDLHHDDYLYFFGK